MDESTPRRASTKKHRKKRTSIAQGEEETLEDVADQAFDRTASAITPELIARFGAK